ncbi:MAG: hypothetical protein VB100_06925, partial [Angelakisella sp.]|nr:hypothetical protein [Angelakisella sp.]
ILTWGLWKSKRPFLSEILLFGKTHAMLSNKYYHSQYKNLKPIESNLLSIGLYSKVSQHTSGL